MRYILRKVLTLIITLFIVSLLAFLAFQVIPGSPATDMLGTNATPEKVAALEAELAQVQAEQEEKATDYVALQSLQERQAELEAALEEKMERWVYLNDLAEQISNQ